MQSQNSLADSMIQTYSESELQRKPLPGLPTPQHPKMEEEIQNSTPGETEEKPKKIVQTVRISDWDEKYKIISITDPVEINPPNPGLHEKLLQKKVKKEKKEKIEGQEAEKKKKDPSKKRYSLSFQYLDNNGQRRSRTIYFGQTKFLYRCDGISGGQAQIINNRITKNLNPFIPEYWVIMILNSGPVLFENIDAYRKQLRK